MAITYNLPIKDWYYDETSKWTLDYPPLFATFEFLLSIVAHLLNLDQVLQLTASQVRTETSITFQKLTVIFSDLAYYIAVYKLCLSIRTYLATREEPASQNHKKAKKGISYSNQNLAEALCNPNLTSAIALLLLCQPSLIMVDHIHFQYNGFLSGIFFMAIASIIKQDYTFGSFWFAILLNFKHIYLYYAPAIGMYLLTGYCMAKPQGEMRIFTFMRRAIKLAIVLLAVMAITYIPFADPKTLRQILGRLFPFKRGLTHAYWAPNFWSLYNTADKVLATVFKDSIRVNFDMESISRTRSASSTSGLVQEYEHQFLMSIKPETTFILVGLFTLPLVFKFLRNIGKTDASLFLKGTVLAAFTSFMFGWHVHEKAIIMIILPLVPAALMDVNLKGILVRLCIAGSYSVFPLLFERAEYPVKTLLLIAYAAYISSIKKRSHTLGYSKLTKCKIFLYQFCDVVFISAIIVNELYTSFLHGKLNYEWNYLTRLNKYQFLPLMMTSFVSAVPILFSYIELLFIFMRSPSNDVITEA